MGWKRDLPVDVRAGGEVLLELLDVWKRGKEEGQLELGLGSRDRGRGSSPEKAMVKGRGDGGGWEVGGSGCPEISLFSPRRPGAKFGGRSVAFPRWRAVPPARPSSRKPQSTTDAPPPKPASPLPDRTLKRSPLMIHPAKGSRRLVRGRPGPT